jgi:prevent-host-death family protein
MKIASVAEIKANLSAYVRASAQSPVIVTRNGRPVAVLISPADDDELERLVLGYSTQLRSILENSKRQIEKGRGVPHDQFWREVEKTSSRKTRSASVREAQAPPGAASTKARSLEKRAKSK